MARKATHSDVEKAAARVKKYSGRYGPRSLKQATTPKAKGQVEQYVKVAGERVRKYRGKVGKKLKQGRLDMSRIKKPKKQGYEVIALNSGIGIHSRRTLPPGSNKSAYKRKGTQGKVIMSSAARPMMSSKKIRHRKGKSSSS